MHNGFILAVTTADSDSNKSNDLATFVLRAHDFASILVELTSLSNLYAIIHVSITEIPDDV